MQGSVSFSAQKTVLVIRLLREGFGRHKRRTDKGELNEAFRTGD